MGQCVTKCKNPSSTLGSKNGDRDPSGKPHSRRGAGHREEQLPACGKPGGDILVNGTRKAEAAPDACQLPTSSGDAGREPRPGAEESSTQRLEELFGRYRDEREDAILEEGMERFCGDLRVDPTEFRVLLLAWKFQAATMCKFTRSVPTPAGGRPRGPGKSPPCSPTGVREAARAEPLGAPVLARAGPRCTRHVAGAACGRAPLLALHTLPRGTWADGDRRPQPPSRSHARRRGRASLERRSVGGMTGPPRGAPCRALGDKRGTETPPCNFQPRLGVPAGRVAGAV